MVPHNHVFQLMRQSLAVLQPSLFEGWSTTVEEAKSVGKSVILSDIPVHHEQDPPAAVYFDPHDPEALADCLMRTFGEKKPGPDYELEAMARERLLKRINQFGRTFFEIVREVVPR
jgi:glycosyltransferase involved in cell wall biosynthesis